MASFAGGRLRGSRGRRRGARSLAVPTLRLVRGADDHLGARRGQLRAPRSADARHRAPRPVLPLGHREEPRGPSARAAHPSLLLLLRVGFVAVVLALGLARLARTATTQKVCTVYVVDVSDSVPDAAPRGRTRRGAARARRAPQGRPRAPRDVREADPAWSRSRTRAKTAPAIERHGTGLGGATDIASALQLAYGLFPEGYIRHTVIVSDGVPGRMGDLLAEGRTGRNRTGVKVFATPYKRPVPGEVAVRDLRVPEHVHEGETFRHPRAGVLERAAEEVKLVLKQGGRRQRPRRGQGGRPPARRQRHPFQEQGGGPR